MVDIGSVIAAHVKEFGVGSVLSPPRPSLRTRTTWWKVSGSSGTYVFGAIGDERPRRQVVESAVPAASALALGASRRHRPEAAPLVMDTLFAVPSLLGIPTSCLF